MRRPVAREVVRVRRTPFGAGGPRCLFQYRWAALQLAPRLCYPDGVVPAASWWTFSPSLASEWSWPSNMWGTLVLPSTALSETQGTSDMVRWRKEHDHKYRSSLHARVALLAGKSCAGCWRPSMRKRRQWRIRWIEASSGRVSIIRWAIAIRLAISPIGTVTASLNRWMWA